MQNRNQKTARNVKQPSACHPKRRRFAIFFIIAALLLAPAAEVSAADAGSGLMTVNAPVRYGQTEARSMYAMVNEFRTGSEAWFWNPGDAGRTVYQPNQLSRLDYDYTLEKVAMQRAAEIAFTFAHSRPSGELCFTAFEEQGVLGYAAGENIAVGQEDAAEAFEAWQETNEGYDGQGHRRNMLAEDFTAIGIGHVELNGIDYWVQEFMAPTENLTPSAANDSVTSVPVQIRTSDILDESLISDVKVLRVPYGGSAELPAAAAAISMPGMYARYVPIAATCTWRIENPRIAEIVGNRVVARQAGKTALVGTAQTDRALTIRIPVKVQPKVQKISGPKSFTKTYGSKPFSLKAKAVGKLTYKSGNNKVVTVSSKGKVTIRGTGKTTVTVKAAAAPGYKKAVKKVTIKVTKKK